MTTKSVAAFDKAIVEASKLGEFTLSDLSVGAHVAAKAVDNGYFRLTKKVRKTGLRGRPARIYTLTAKAKKV